MPTSEPTIPVARPTLREEEAAAARRAILAAWVVQGPDVAAFEEAFAAAVGASGAGPALKRISLVNPTEV